jgi:hypothetical protein
VQDSIPTHSGRARLSDIATKTKPVSMNVHCPGLKVSAASMRQL